MVVQLPVSRGKFALPVLTAIVVGSMVGGGIFTLPGSLGRVAGPQGAILAWVIAGAGMFAFARVLQLLALRLPELHGGIYIYAREGFGNYVGFLSVFGYWLAGCLGNCTYWVVIKATLGAYLPVFAGGHNVASIALASAGIWTAHFIMLRGPPQSAMVNLVSTIAKLVPLIVFLFVLAAAWNLEVFQANLKDSVGGTGLGQQVKATMLVTLYTLLGVEGASVYSAFARRRADVGRATLLGLLVVTIILVLVTVMPYGVIARSELAGIRQPSMAGILSAVIGPAGGVLVGAGLIISVSGAYFAWTMICAEVLFVAAHRGDMPKIFRQANGNHAPVAALFASSLVVQVMMIATYWSSAPYYMMLQLTSEMSLIPFLLTALFGTGVLWRERTRGLHRARRPANLIIAICAVLYTLLLVFAGGSRAIANTAIFYSIGTCLYIIASKEQHRRVFNIWEKAIFAGTLIIGAWAAGDLIQNGLPVPSLAEFRS